MEYVNNEGYKNRPGFFYPISVPIVFLIYNIVGNKFASAISWTVSFMIKSSGL